MFHEKERWKFCITYLSNFWAQFTKTKLLFKKCKGKNGKVHMVMNSPDFCFFAEDVINSVTFFSHNTAIFFCSLQDRGLACSWDAFLGRIFWRVCIIQPSKITQPLQIWSTRFSNNGVDETWKKSLQIHWWQKRLSR